MPWFGRIHPGSFVVPRGTDSTLSARWNVQFIERSVEDVKMDPRLNKTTAAGNRCWLALT